MGVKSYESIRSLQPLNLYTKGLGFIGPKNNIYSKMVNLRENTLDSKYVWSEYL